jgi:hypothetical protein
MVCIVYGEYSENSYYLQTKLPSRLTKPKSSALHCSFVQNSPLVPLHPTLEVPSGGK